MSEATSTIQNPKKDIPSDDFLTSACGNCGSKNLTWNCQAQNRGGVVDGRICMREVGVIFYLGCDECSETVQIIDGDKIAEMMTETLKDSP